MTARRLLTAAFLVAFAAAPATAQTVSELVSARGRSTSPFAAVVSRANESTVRVRCDDKDTVLGTVVFADGYVLTKASELYGRVTVRLGDGTEQDADIVAVHKPTDLALLKVDARGLHPVKFAASKKVPVGNWVAAAKPGAGPQSVGIVSVTTRDLSGADAVPDTLNPNRGFLGIRLALKDPDDGGAQVDVVEPRSGADKAGLKKDDVICELEGKSIASRLALQELLDGYRPGDVVKIKLRRDGQEIEKKVTLSGPIGLANRGDLQNTLGGHKLSGRRTGFPSILQTDMFLRPEQCGGPVVDLDGKVLGVSIARAGRVETWVLPSETITALLPDLKAGKFPPVSLKKEKDPK
jgi:serine protease Do